MNGSIIRLERGDEGTFGVLLLRDKCYCATLELPWLNNADNVSCIPNGRYTCIKHNSPTHGQVWQLNDVPERDNVQIHAGNTMSDTLGCILLGQYFGKLRGGRAVLNSGATYRKFMQVTRHADELDLTIETHSSIPRINCL